MQGLEIQKGKSAMKDAEFVKEYGPSAACARRVAELTRNCFSPSKRADARWLVVMDAGFGAT